MARNLLGTSLSISCWTVWTAAAWLLVERERRYRGLEGVLGAARELEAGEMGESKQAGKEN